MNSTFLACCHHIVIDGLGIALVGRRAATIYSAIVSGERIPPAYFGSMQNLVDCESDYEASNDYREKDEPIGAGTFPGKAGRIIGCPKPGASVIRTRLPRRLGLDPSRRRQNQRVIQSVAHPSIIGHHRGVRTNCAWVVHYRFRGGAQLPGQQASASRVKDASRDACRGCAAGVEGVAGVYGCRFLSACGHAITGTAAPSAVSSARS